MAELLVVFAVGLSSTVAGSLSQLVADVVQLVSLLRQIAVKACLVLSTLLLTSVVAFIVLRRLEPVAPAAAAAAAAGEVSPRPPPHGHLGDAADGPAADAASVADRTCSKTAQRMPFSETHV